MQTQTAIRSEAVRYSVLPARNVPPLPNRVIHGAIGVGPLDQTMHLAGATMSYPRNAEIFGENEPADHLYKVLSGSVRTYKILSDGRRQIGRVLSSRRHLRPRLFRRARTFSRSDY